MVFTANQVTAFFEEPGQMAIPHNTRASLVAEGIDTIDALDDFSEADFKQVASNIRRAQPPVVLGAKSIKRLNIAATAMQYYRLVSHVPTHSNMHYENCLRDFYEQWEHLLKKGEESNPDTPCITRTLPIIKWTESFEEFLHQVLGVQHVPLSYVIRTDAAVGPAPPLIANRSYSQLHGSVEDELVARSSHNGATFKSDNAMVFKYIEEATRETRYHSSVTPFSRRKDGRGAWRALLAQYVGLDKWQSELDRQENFLHTRVWKGNSTFTLESFIMQHRAAHISMIRCATHVPYQLPNERTRVIHLLNGIKSSDAELLSALAVVKSDDGPNGKMERFEETAAYLIRFDPVSAKRRKTGASGRQQQVSSLEIKNGIGKTGVSLRYHSSEEYKKLTDEQKLELKEYRQSNKNNKRKGDNKSEEGNEGGGKRQKRSFKKQLIAALQEIQQEDAKQDAEENDAREMITSVVQEIMSVGQPTKKVALPPAPSNTAVRKPMNSILNRLKNLRNSSKKP